MPLSHNKVDLCKEVENVRPIIDLECKRDGIRER